LSVKKSASAKRVVVNNSLNANIYIQRLRIKKAALAAFFI
jgi:hypothetical protein